ncbi:hypothetical protein UFOVP23_34 [uncultured Caudovirales phage]|uniref:Scaffolding protein n=1 Tax=uncultured Caudovirales phage TaxID=2100421 RepID=A0A6J5TAL8_9CAUD|nr:hypothetical protein UFOVP23_34 [uncultured Caudovirales phage]
MSSTLGGIPVIPKNENATDTRTNSPMPENQPSSNSTEVQPSWYLDESTPGMGARPDWLPPKYQRVSDVARAYEALEKKLGAFTGAPESYDFTELEIDENQHVVKELTAVARELNMSQEGLQKFLGRFASAAEAESNLHLETEVAKLGKDGERQLIQFKNAMKDHFKPEEAEVVAEWVKSADDLKVFNRIMSSTHMSAVPTQTTMANANYFESESDLRTELVKNIKRYNEDATYRKDYSSRLERAVQRGSR